MAQFTIGDTERELEEQEELYVEEVSLTDAQIEALEDMINRRIENTGEDRKTAVWNIRSYLSAMI
jgi:predicted component of viral defense system (DUF524 family)